MPRTVPLLPNVPHQSFSVRLGSYTLAFKFDWVTRFSFFRVQIKDITDNEVMVSRSRSANLGVNILRGFPQYGEVYIQGAQPTIENLGINAVLKWETPTDA